MAKGADASRVEGMNCPGAQKQALSEVLGAQGWWADLGWQEEPLPVGLEGHLDSLPNSMHPPHKAVLRLSSQAPVGQILCQSCFQGASCLSRPPTLGCPSTWLKINMHFPQDSEIGYRCTGEGSKHCCGPAPCPPPKYCCMVPRDKGLQECKASRRLLMPGLHHPGSSSAISV